MSQLMPTHAHRIGLVLALIVAFVLASMFVLRTSSAAFSDQTDNTGNGFASSDVVLNDDDSGLAMFDLSDIDQGDSFTNCIDVRYEGTSDPQPVTAFSSGYTDSGTFATFLQMQISQGDAGATCAGFSGTTVFNGTVASFDAAHTDYASGIGTWDPGVGPETRAYEFTITLDPATPNSQGGESVSGLGFIWEVQS